ncbi:MAG: VanZ family protein [Phycisphaerae bacterium]|nr:VanZ family protein [Phycisphaerae bacterium]
MPLMRRHKYMLVAIGFYWPAIFIATHIPIPSDLIRNAGMSDKTMHFLAYLALVSIAWFAVSPFEKVDWKKSKVWIILAAVVLYGAFDEWLQGFVGRSPDVLDFVYDVSAALTALVIMTFLTFWPAVLTLATFFIFAITCLTSPNITFQNEYINSAFFFLAYAFFTLVWIQSSQRIWNIKRSQAKWFISSIGVPAAALTAMTGLSLAFGKEFWPLNIITAALAIIAATATTYLTTKICNKKTKN